MLKVILARGKLVLCSLEYAQGDSYTWDTCTLWPGVCLRWFSHVGNFYSVTWCMLKVILTHGKHVLWYPIMFTLTLVNRCSTWKIGTSQSTLHNVHISCNLRPPRGNPNIWESCITWPILGYSPDSLADNLARQPPSNTQEKRRH